MIPGWTIARTIPYETLIGLATGKYKLYGGVVRWAAGTPNAGQIIRHLIPVASNPLGIIPGLNFIPGIVANIQLADLKGITEFNSYQLMRLSGQIYTLSQSTQQILQVATGAAVLSGLGLVVSSIGFVAINSKLNTIDSRLKEIQKDVQAIKYFLESSERARLFAALAALLKIDAKTASEHRHTILHTARNTLAEINMRYRELLAEATTIETAMAHEEYFSLTALAQTRCTAELGMLDMAHKEIQEMNTFWQSQALRISRELLVGKHPERFLATDFVDEVSTAELIQWLDFVYEEKKGLGWIDELRRKFNEPWYSKGWFSGAGSGLNQNVGIGLEKEQTMLIPALKKLMARGAVFEGYVVQYELLEEQQMKPSEFEHQLAALPESSLVEGYVILEPSKTASKVGSAV
ncbi:hypothetical protein [Pantanalinema sp. GBBB05]|uniref:hypothetical protein n=1 Tax=Pantanalinema sp. GBBB05 TaxID=2604139 RepID=UPI001D808582|nr:hypothetical protein [Pantanalinema sp. GBBB05]